jgi:hypothetical protein
MPKSTDRRTPLDEIRESDWRDDAATEILKWLYGDTMTEVQRAHTQAQIYAIIFRHSQSSKGRAEVSSLESRLQQAQEQLDEWRDAAAWAAKQPEIPAIDWQSRAAYRKVREGK